jgi:hypothetical protein
MHRNERAPRPVLKDGQEAVQVLDLRIGDRVDLGYGFAVLRVLGMSRRGHPVLENGITLCPRTMWVARCKPG